MHSTAQMSGQYHHVGLASSPQAANMLTHNTTWTQQTVQANSSCQYMTAQYQPASLHQTNIPSSNLQNSTNMQSGNPPLQVINVTNHNFYQNSAQHPNPNIMFTSPPQNRGAHWNQSASVQQQQSMRTQTGNPVSHLTPQRASRKGSPKSYPAHVTTATSVQRQNTVYTNILVSPAAHISQSVPNQNNRYVTQRGICSSTSPPTYHATVSHLKNQSTTSNSSSNGQMQHNPRTTQQQTQQQYVLLHNPQTSRPSAPAVYAQTHSITEIQEIARIVKNLRSCERMAGNRVKECNQTVQPVTSANANGCNLNIPQRAHHVVNVPLQQSSVTNVAYVLTPVGSNGIAFRAGGASVPQNGSPAKKSTNDPSLLRLMLMNESPSCQRSQVQSSAANDREKPETLSTVTRNDIQHTSPGSTATRAVAVVLPLSQESNQGANKDTSSNDTSWPDKCPQTDTFLSSPQKSVENITYSASSSDCTRENVTAMQVDQCVASAAVTPEVPESQNGNTDEITADPKAHVLELSSVPTTPWTYNSLARLIKESEESQTASEENDAFNKIPNMFWDGSLNNLAVKVKAGWYRSLIPSVVEFCHMNLKADSVILSQVTQSPEKLAESYYVLKDNEIYSERPYTSSWLNVNKNLDDIEKEFGYPMSLKYSLNILKSLCQPDQVGTANSVPIQTASDVPTKVVPPTEVESVDSGEEKQASPAESISPQTSSPSRSENDDSGDPYYSFRIEVLPPEEAKMIFQKIEIPQSTDVDSQSEIPQSTDVDSQPKEVIKSSAEDKLPNARATAVNVVCCIDKWMQQFVGPSESKCKCDEEQRDQPCAEMEATAAQKNEELSVVSSGSKSPSPIVRLVRPEDIDIPCNGADLSNDVRPAVDLNEDAENPDSQNISHITLDTSIILISESEDENQPSGETPTQISNSEDPTLNPDKECSQDHLKPEESAQSSSSDHSMEEIQNTLAHTLTHEEDCAQAQLTSADSSMEVEEQTEISGTVALQQQTNFSVTQKHERVQLKRKTPSTTDHLFPSLENAKRPRLSDDMDTQSAFGDAKLNKYFVDAEKPRPSDDMDTQSAFGDAKLKKDFFDAEKPRSSDDMDTPSAFQNAKCKKDFVEAKKPRLSDDADTQFAFQDAKLNKHFVDVAKPRPSDDMDTQSAFGDAKCKKDFFDAEKPRSSDDMDTQSAFGDAKLKKDFFDAEKPRSSDDMDTQSAFQNAKCKKDFVEAKKPRLSDDMDTQSAFGDAKCKKDFVEAKKPRLSDDVDTQSACQDAKLSKYFVDAAHGETVELALYGSTMKRKCRSSSSECFFGGARRAPTVLKVILSPPKRTPSVPPSVPSVKQHLYEKWRRSYPLPIKIQCRRTKTKKSASASSSVENPKKAETEAPKTNNEELPGDSERSTCTGNTKTPVKTVQKSILRFCVLPNLVDGPKERTQTSGHLSDDDDFVDGEDKSVRITILRKPGTWAPPPKEKFKPLRTATEQLSSVAFQQFQRKYRKIQRSIAK